MIGVHRCDDGPARANRFGDLRVAVELQVFLACRWTLELGDDPAAFAAGGDGHKGAVRQVQRPSQAPHQRQHQLVRIEPGLNKCLGRLPKLLLLRPPGCVQPVPDPGMQPGAELRQVDRGRQGVGRTERQGGGRRITIGGCDYDDTGRDARRPLARGREQVNQGTLVDIVYGDEDSVGVGVDGRVFALDQLEAAAGKRAFQPRRASGWVTHEEHPRASERLHCLLSHSLQRSKCIGLISQSAWAHMYRSRVESKRHQSEAR